MYFKNNAKNVEVYFLCRPFQWLSLDWDASYSKLVHVK